MNMKMKALKISWMLVVILTCNLFFVSCFSEDNPVSEKATSSSSPVSAKTTLFLRKNNQKLFSRSNWMRP